MKLSIAFTLVSLFMAQTSFAYGELTGDTFASAASNVSSLKSEIHQLMNRNKKDGKGICAELGTAIGHATAASSEINFHSQEFFDDASAIGKDLSGKIKTVVERLTAARNEFCLADTTQFNKVKEAIVEADITASEIAKILKTVRAEIKAGNTEFFKTESASLEL